MKKILTCAVFAAAFCTTMSCLKADEVDLARVLGHGQSCDHVINLVMRHGVNNSVDQHSAGFVHNAGFGPMVIAGADIGDLELMQVTSLPHSDPACGPKFAVVIRNNSTRDVCGPRVSAVALLGRICSTSPTSVVKVDKICAGQSIEVHVQLPLEALSMGNHNGAVVGFRRLLVAIDSFDQFVENNEANNIKVFDLASISIATTAIVPAAAVEASAVGQPAQQQTQQAVQVPATQSVESAPATDDLQSAMQKLTDATPASSVL
ncbi:MAG: hypothetical protein WBD20_22765 [Pirellulaceae bacterium]